MSDTQETLLQIGDLVTVVSVSVPSYKSLIGSCGEIVTNDSTSSPPGKLKVDFGEFVGWYYPAQLSLDTEIRDRETARRVLKYQLKQDKITLSEAQILGLLNILK